MHGHVQTHSKHAGQAGYFLPPDTVMHHSFSFLSSVWVHWVFVAACRPSLVVMSQGYFCVKVVSHVVKHMGSRVHSLSSCGPRAELPCSMWDLPRPGIEPKFPALAGGFLTTGPPGKFPFSLLKALYSLSFPKPGPHHSHLEATDAGTVIK